MFFFFLSDRIVPCAQVAGFGETRLCLGGGIIFLDFKMSFHPDFFLFLPIWMEASWMKCPTVIFTKNGFKAPTGL